jgi:hypothetical protein
VQCPSACPGTSAAAGTRGTRLQRHAKSWKGMKKE